MASEDFEKLEQRISALKSRFLNFSVSPEAGAPTQDELDSIACFKLLSHSEVEWFIEARSRSALSVALAAWKRERKWSHCIAALIHGWGAYPEVNFRQYTAETAEGVVDALVDARAKSAGEEISKNNSVKKEAFLRLAYIAGMPQSSHSPELLGALESFGSTRGDVAHQPVGRVRSLDAPEVEAERADQLVLLLKAFDDELTLPR